MQKMIDVNWQRNLWLLWFSQILVMAGFAAMIPFIPLFMQDELGITDEGKLGIYVSMFSFFGTLAYAVFCPLWGVLADRYGVRVMLLRGTFVTGFIFPLMGYVHSAWMLITLRFITAACAGTTAASQTLLARTVPDNRQGFAQGVLTTAIWGGSMLGNVIGGLLIYYFNYKAAFWFCGVLYVLAGISCIFTQDDFVRSEEPEKKEETKHAHVPRPPFVPAFTYAVWVMMLLFLLLGLDRYFETPYIAMKIKTITGNETAAYWTGIVSAAVAVGAVLSGVIAGWLADRMSPVKLILPILVISGITLVLQGLSGGLWLFGGSRTLLYVAAGGLQPVLQKILTGVTPKRKRGSVFGFASCFQNIGVMLAAVFSGWAVLGFGVDGVFYTTAALCVISIPVFIGFLNFVMKDGYYRSHQV